MPLQIFVSYASKNRPIVEGLIEDLEMVNHQLWYDQKLTGGQIWWDEICHEIESRDTIIIALTQQYLDSVACMRELNYAASLKKRIVPIQLGEVTYATLPAEISKFHIVNYQSADKQAGLRLNGALNSLPPIAPIPEPCPPRPPVPMSPLSLISQRLDTPTLSVDEQQGVVIELKTHLTAKHADVKAIRELFEKLSEKSYVARSISDEIRDILLRISLPVNNFTYPIVLSDQRSLVDIFADALQTAFVERRTFRFGQIRVEFSKLTRATPQLFQRRELAKQQLLRETIAPLILLAIFTDFYTLWSYLASPSFNITPSTWLILASIMCSAGAIFLAWKAIQPIFYIFAQLEIGTHQVTPEIMREMSKLGWRREDVKVANEHHLRFVKLWYCRGRNLDAPMPDEKFWKPVYLELEEIHNLLAIPLSAENAISLGLD